MEKEVAQVIELAALGTGHVEYASFSVSADFNFNFLHLDLRALHRKKTVSNFQAEEMHGKTWSCLRSLLALPSLRIFAKVLTYMIASTLGLSGSQEGKRLLFAPPSS